MGRSILTAQELATQCGAKTYGASAHISDGMMLNAQSVDALMHHVRNQLGTSLAHVIAAEAQDLTVQRRDDRGIFLSFGGTEYRMEAVVFSKETFSSFCDRLLEAYGNHYADAAMSTKKAQLHKAIDQL